MAAPNTVSLDGLAPVEKLASAPVARATTWRLRADDRYASFPAATPRTWDSAGMLTIVCTAPPSVVTVRITFEDPVVTAQTTSDGPPGVGVGVAEMPADELGVVAPVLPPHAITPSDTAITAKLSGRTFMMPRVSLSYGCPERGGADCSGAVPSRARDPENMHYQEFEHRSLRVGLVPPRVRIRRYETAVALVAAHCSVRGGVYRRLGGERADTHDPHGPRHQLLAIRAGRRPRPSAARVQRRRPVSVPERQRPAQPGAPLSCRAACRQDGLGGQPVAAHGVDPRRVQRLLATPRAGGDAAHHRCHGQAGAPHPTPRGGRRDPPGTAALPR